MKELKDVTLASIDCVNPGAAISSLKKSLQQIIPFKTILFTNIDICIEGIEVVKIETLDIEGYSHFVMKRLNSYIETDYVIIQQHDGYILSGDAWDESFYNYDYIGAKWLYKDQRNVGNGGFQLKSKMLLNILSEDDNIEICHPEDECTGRLYRNYLERMYNVKFATEEVADKFSFELNEPTNFTFGFHSYFHQPFKEHIVIKRTAAMGDVVMAIPILDYYHNKGYQVVLDTLPEMMGIFFNHPYRVKHISEMHPNIKPYKIINLDGSYESKPKKRVLDVYYEFSEIHDGTFENSKLYVTQEPHQRLFKKYIVFHVPKMDMEYRNSYDVNWQFVSNYFNRLGYTPIQVCNNEPIGIHFNAETKPMLLFLLNGADLVIGLDSGICQLSVALGVPTVILSGSVNLELRYNDFEKIGVVQGKCHDEKHKHCYHSQEGATVGKKCIFNEKKPPCATHSEWDILREANKLLKIN